MTKVENLSPSPTEFSFSVEIIKLKEHPVPLIKKVISTMKQFGLSPI